MWETAKKFHWGKVVMLFCLVVPLSAVAGSGSGKEKGISGKWRRPDGGYVLNLSGVGKGGTLTAAYFNPRPIKVARAEWRRQQEKISVTIELRDANYPGSTYTLAYLPAQDLLAGNYYQAALGENFEVVFERVE